MKNTNNTTPAAITAAKSKITAGVTFLAAVCATVLLSAGSAYAGSWMEVSCENPGGSSAPSQGWSSFTGGTPGYGSNNSTSCSAGNPMYAILSTDASDPTGTAETLHYTPPAGSTLAGGSLDLGMYADGHGYNASGTAVLYTPEYKYDGSDVLLQCDWGLEPCSNGTNDFTGILSLPNRGGNIYISASCGGASGASCGEGGSHGAWSLTQVWWADLLLTNNTTPTANNITGTLLTPNARGTQELILTANDPGGPGIYTLTVQADGKTLYDTTPDTNSGECVPVGSDGNALMFDYSQPCKTSEALDLSINTTGLQDGPHTLKITVTDAAGNTSVVYDNTITTHNAPAETTAPTIATTGQIYPGNQLTTTPGAWTAPSGTGTMTYAYQWEDCSASGSECQAIPGAVGSAYTVAAGDVGHTLRLQVTAANNDGASASTSPPTSSVLPAASSGGAPNGPGGSGGGETTTGGSIPGAGGSPGAGSTTGAGGSTSAGGSLQGSTSNGTSSAVALGVPNGVGATEVAQLRLGTHNSISMPYARRAFTLPGRLLNSQGQPISGATLEVLQQTQGTTTMSPLARASTHADGSFVVHVPAGPSRMVEVAYRAYPGEQGYAGLAQVNETVSAGVQLQIAPRRTTPTGTIQLTGRVLGPIPKHGVIVELTVHYLGSWVPVRTPRVYNTKRFDFAYTFKGSRGRFPFRAEVRGAQANYPYTLGYSHIIDVITH